MRAIYIEHGLNNSIFIYKSGLHVCSLIANVYFIRDDCSVPLTVLQ